MITVYKIGKNTTSQVYAFMYMRSNEGGPATTIYSDNLEELEEQRDIEELEGRILPTIS
jgi:hypothetical protein